MFLAGRWRAYCPGLGRLIIPSAAFQLLEFPQQGRPQISGLLILAHAEVRNIAQTIQTSASAAGLAVLVSAARINVTYRIEAPVQHRHARNRTGLFSSRALDTSREERELP